MIVFDPPTEVHKDALSWWLYLALSITWILSGMRLSSYRVAFDVRRIDRLILRRSLDSVDPRPPRP
jgi:hypothetical protein